MEVALDGARIDAFVDLERFVVDFAPLRLELVTTLSSRSTLRLTVRVAKKFRHFSKYPPDYNRGFDVAGGELRVLGHPGVEQVVQYQALGLGVRKETVRRVARRWLSAQLLVLLPYPDMSMVFNVIAFSSTLFAFFFGSAFNNLYRDIDDLDKRNVHVLREWLKWLALKAYDKLACMACCKRKQAKDKDE